MGNAGGTAGLLGFGDSTHHGLAALCHHHAVNHDGLRQRCRKGIAFLIAVGRQRLFGANRYERARPHGHLRGQTIMRRAGSSSRWPVILWRAEWRRGAWLRSALRLAVSIRLVYGLGGVLGLRVGNGALSRGSRLFLYSRRRIAGAAPATSGRLVLRENHRGTG